MPATTTTTTPPSSPTVRNPTTGCVVHLSTSLVPVRITHTARCKCMAVRSDEEIDQLAVNVRRAVEEGILEHEKPALAFAMILLGADVVYE
ncbi:hypothetical protein O1611_g4201 [Lasiodiplodia mahajangana]|uniref:Uncharacterized protein n=1 Tax=Lasiodiplodia mahajangana TaxID=1108764 RepID=A0ACC2JPR7_9PEZI|nr:hypothetical protein O1611_g4201 [Lasiodiplodia mahajangana]